MMEAHEEEEFLLDYDWDEEIDGPMPGTIDYSLPVLSNKLLSDGPVQDVPTARDSTVVTVMGLTRPSHVVESASNPGLQGLEGSPEKDAVVVGPLHVKGFHSITTKKRPNQRSRLRAKAVRAQGNLGTAAMPLLLGSNGAPTASPGQGAPVTSDLDRG